MTMAIVAMAVMVMMRMSYSNYNLPARCGNQRRHETDQTENSKRNLLQTHGRIPFSLSFLCADWIITIRLHQIKPNHST
jgi:hypothetical protein